MPLCCMLQEKIALYENAINNFTLTLQSSLQFYELELKFTT